MSQEEYKRYCEVMEDTKIKYPTSREFIPDSDAVIDYNRVCYYDSCRCKHCTTTIFERDDGSETYFIQPRVLSISDGGDRQEICLDCLEEFLALKKPKQPEDPIRANVHSLLATYERNWKRETRGRSYVRAAVYGDAITDLNRILDTNATEEGDK